MWVSLGVTLSRDISEKSRELGQLPGTPEEVTYIGIELPDCLNSNLVLLGYPLQNVVIPSGFGGLGTIEH